MFFLRIFANKPKRSVIKSCRLLKEIATRIERMNRTRSMTLPLLVSNLWRDLLVKEKSSTKQMDCISWLGILDCVQPILYKGMLLFPSYLLSCRARPIIYMNANKAVTRSVTSGFYEVIAIWLPSSVSVRDHSWRVTGPLIHYTRESRSCGSLYRWAQTIISHVRCSIANLSQVLQFYSQLTPGTNNWQHSSALKYCFK